MRSPAPGPRLLGVAVALRQDEIPVRRWSVDDFHRLYELGVVTDDDRVELLEGLIVEMAPITDEHQDAVDVLNRHITRATEHLVRVQGPLTFPEERSRPQPDLSVFPLDAPRPVHASQALLVVEVAVTSHVVDRKVKAPLYARAGIPEYWLVDVPAACVEVRRRPEGDEYADLAVLRGGDALVPAAFEVPPLEVARLLARP